MRPLTLVFAVCGLLTVMAPVVSPSALFPGTLTNAALRKPVASNGTCGSPPVMRSDGDCDATCPLVTTGTSPSAFSVDPHPECGCAGAHSEMVSPSDCCIPETESCTPRVNAQTRPAQSAFDGTEQTFWQSQPDATNVELAVDLLAEHVGVVLVDDNSLLLLQEVFSVELKFDGPVPAAALLQRSTDGSTWVDYQVRSVLMAIAHPAQYYAFDCNAFFGLPQDRYTAHQGFSCLMISSSLDQQDSVNCISADSEAQDRTMFFSTVSRQRTAG